MKLSAKKLKILVDYFCDKPIRRVYLIGSYARGDATRASDVDILLEPDHDSNRPIDVARYRSELSVLMAMHADINLQNRTLRYARANIARDKVLIHRMRRASSF